MAVWSPDPMLSAVVALGLGASLSTALVIDLAGDLRVPSRRSLADLISDGPSSAELSPGRSGVAVASGAGARELDSRSLADSLATGWPSVIVRLGAPRWEGALIPVRPLYPGWMAPTTGSASVWQPLGGAGTAPGPGPVLPRLGHRVASSLLGGRIPVRSRWVRALAPVWELPWGS